MSVQSYIPREDLIYETKAALTFGEQSWRSLAMNGRSVKVTTKAIKAEGYPSIALDAVLNCEHKSTWYLMNPHVVLEYRGSDGTRQYMRFYPVRWVFVQSPDDFAADLNEAINRALKVFKEDASDGPETSSRKGETLYIPEKKAHPLLVIVGMAIGVVIGLTVIGGVTGFVNGMFFGGAIAMVLHGIVGSDIGK